MQLLVANRWRLDLDRLQWLDELQPISLHAVLRTGLEAVVAFRFRILGKLYERLLMDGEENKNGASTARPAAFALA